ncbi:MAG: rhomboid family intramembrane serine protease [Planctomycetota bacterium]
MGLHDRPYMQDEPAYRGGMPRGEGGLTFGLPRPGRAVKTLLILNGVVFLLQIFADQPTPRRPVGAMSAWLGLTARDAWQLWRFVTFQFLHGGLWHILLNMLGLYFLGTPMEQRYGSRKFVGFYLSCGVTAGLTYMLFNLAMGTPGWRPLVGASGGVYGLILACAVLFPQFRLIFRFFPVPIRLAAVIIFGIMAFTLLSGLAAPDPPGGAFWSQAAHFGGVLAAAGWFWVLPRARQAGAGARVRLNQGAWQRRMRRQADEQKRIDRILEKIKHEGLDALTPAERQKLQDATRKQRRQDSRIRRL